MSRPDRVLAAFAALALTASGCSLYFGDDDASGDDDAPPPAVDAGPRTVDASPVPAPDATEQCQTVDEFLARFGACMQLMDWQAAGMCDVPNQGTGGMGQCTACHSEGEDRAFLSADCEATFTAHRTEPYIEGLIRVLGDSQDCFTGFGSGTLLNPTFVGVHPDATFTAKRVQAINDFLSFVFSRVNDPQIACD